MPKPPRSTPTGYTYTVLQRIHSDRPYTMAEIQDPVKWWVFIKDRQVKVETVTVKTPTKGGKKK